MPGNQAAIVASEMERRSSMMRGLPDRSTLTTGIRESAYLTAEITVRSYCEIGTLRLVGSLSGR